MDTDKTKHALERQVLSFLNQCVKVNTEWCVEDLNTHTMSEDELNWLNDHRVRLLVDSDGEKIQLNVINWFSHTQALTGLTFFPKVLPLTHKALTVDIAAEISDGLGTRLLHTALGSCLMSVQIQLPSGFEFQEQNFGSDPYIEFTGVQLDPALADQDCVEKHKRLRQSLLPFERALTVSALASSYKNLHAFVQLDEGDFFQQQLPSPEKNTFDQFFE
jgi:hypothetical protein